MTLLRLALRSTRVGLLVVAGVGAVFVTVGIKAYETAGGGAQLVVLAENPSLRALLGVPWDLTTAGGFVTWRMTAFLALVTGVWALLAVTRQLRGSEDAGLAELLLAGRSSRRDWVVSVVAALWLAGGVLALAVLLSALAGGLAAWPSLLWAASIGLGLWVIGGIGAVCSQVMAQRRAAAGLAAAVMGGLFVVRMAADAAVSWGWARWLTPFGWIESVRAFDAGAWFPLLLLLATSVLLAVAAVLLAQRRDLGSGLWQARPAPASHTGLLASAWTYALRRRLRELRWWAPSLLAVALLYGYLAGEVVAFVRDDAGYRRLVEDFGMAGLVTVEGYVAVMALMMSVVVVSYVVVVVHAEADDEEVGRLDLVYAAPVTRDGWLGALVGSTLGGAVALSALSGVGLWLGALLGGGQLSWAHAMSAVVATWPVVVALLAVCLVVIGWSPRHVAAAGGGVAAAWLLLALFGPMLSLPSWLVSLSPYDHLGQVPLTGWDLPGTLAVSGLGLLAGALGWLAYRRRDLL